MPDRLMLLLGTAEQCDSGQVGNRDRGVWKQEARETDEACHAYYPPPLLPYSLALTAHSCLRQALQINDAS